MKGQLFTLGILSLSLLLGTGQALGQPTEHRKGPKHDAHAHQPISIEEAVIRAIFRGEPQLAHSSRDLPPGIRKNLARGKPIPPGLAKRFHPQLEARLPQYPGYEWRQLGRDAVLVAITTGVVEAVLSNIFD